ncbi:PPE domain-containing protein [Actinokineospora soli]|uniref:PPE domain-containing protein n=1 Tax=Actinokineospora soli TaxID=1048753 RepID=A0ABW2TWE7_9PSEU
MAVHRWRGYDHPELYRMINSGPGPAASTPQTEYWDSLMRELGDIDHDLNAKLSTLAASWQGAAGDQAQGALNPLQQWAGDAQTGANVMRSSTEYQADIVARARAEMPEPVKVTTPAPSGWSKLAAGAALLGGNPGPAMAVANQASDHEAQEAAQDAAAQKAVDTMESYADSSEFNRNTLGEFVPPPDVVVSTPAPSGGAGGSVTHFSSATSGYTTGAGSSPAPSYSGSPTPGGGGSGYTPPSGSGVSYTPVGPGAAPTTPAGYVTPSGTTVPSTFAPPTTTAPVGPAVPGQTPPAFGGPLPLPLSGGGDGSTGVRGGRPGVPFGPGGLEAEPTRGNQAFRPGLAGMAGEAAAARGGLVGVPTPTPTSARGGAGMGAATPLGARDDGDDDREHGLADYLIETVDVFGDERTVSQPIIGGDPDR